MKKRTISVLLMICMIILSANGLSALAFNEIDSEEVILEPIQTEANDNIYNKIHFYFGEDAYQTIDTFDELTKAVNNTAKKVNETAAAMSRSGNVSEESFTNEICVTVEFASDYMQTKEFLAFSEERNHLDSIDEVHEFRSRLNAFSKSYHEKMAKENIKDLSAFSYTKVSPIAYSPFVTMTMPVDNVNVSSLKSVAENTNVLEISLSYQSASYEPEFESQDAVESRSQSSVGPGDHLADDFRHQRHFLLRHALTQPDTLFAQHFSVHTDKACCTTVTVQVYTDGISRLR